MEETSCLNNVKSICFSCSLWSGTLLIARKGIRDPWLPPAKFTCRVLRRRGGRCEVHDRKVYNIFHLKHLCHKHFCCKHIHCKTNWLKGNFAAKDKIADSFELDSLVSTSWNELAFLPASDVTDGFIKLTDGGEFFPKELVFLFWNYIGGEEAEGLEGTELNPHFHRSLKWLSKNMGQNAKNKEQWRGFHYTAWSSRCREKPS